MRVGIFAHSTNPRGGVVHAMQLAEALCACGVDATLLAPAPEDRGFFRAPRCPSLLIPAAPASDDVETMVQTRRREIAHFLQSPTAPRFDILHAQDSVSGLALSDLASAGWIRGYLRTVHHLDNFENPRLAAWQDRSVRNAAHLFCVSEMGRSELRLRFGRESSLVGNGVDTQRFTAVQGPRDAKLRLRLLPGGGRMLLAVGGVEARKNTLSMLRAFLLLTGQGKHPDLHLVIAGGASLLDHRQAAREFAKIVQQSGSASRIVLAGVIDDAEMPALYRNASMLCCASLQEGFGLCVIEALASGIPVIVPRGAPFDEYLAPGDAILADPLSELSIATAMEQALHESAIRDGAMRGPARATQLSWRRVAESHLDAYRYYQPEMSLHA